MTLRLLFVDDEPHVLDGLRRMLRDMRGEWEMEFADGGSAAVEKVAAEAYDVVISDMRMPGMSGAEVLEEVRRRSPQTVRIILSGHADLEMIYRTVGPAHQFLSKPCDPSQLKGAVARAGALRSLLSNDALRRTVTGMRTLPSLPALFQELMVEMRSPDTSFDKVSSIMTRDLGMTAKVLQLVNSSFFGLPRRVKTVREAVALLGLTTINSLVLSVGAFSAFDAQRCPVLAIDALWGHALKVSLVAGRIAASEEGPETLAADAGMAGLLHEVGRLVLATADPARYAEAVARASRGTGGLSDAERVGFGFGAPEAGAYLLGIWGLGDDIIEAVAFHRNPSNCVNARFSPLTAVHAACGLSDGGDVDREYLKRTGKDGRLDAWRGIAASTGPQEEVA